MSASTIRLAGDDGVSGLSDVRHVRHHERRASVSRSCNLTHRFQIVIDYPSYTMDAIVRRRQTELLRVTSTVDTRGRRFNFGFREHLPVDAAPSHVSTQALQVVRTATATRRLSYL